MNRKEIAEALKEAIEPLNPFNHERHRYWFIGPFELREQTTRTTPESYRRELEARIDAWAAEENKPSKGEG